MNTQIIHINIYIHFNLILKCQNNNNIKYLIFIIRVITRTLRFKNNSVVYFLVFKIYNFSIIVGMMRVVSSNFIFFIITLSIYLHSV